MYKNEKMHVQSVQNYCSNYSVFKFVTFLSPARRSWRCLLEFRVIRVFVVVNIIRQLEQDDEENKDDDGNEG